MSLPEKVTHRKRRRNQTTKIHDKTMYKHALSVITSHTLISSQVIFKRVRHFAACCLVFRIGNTLSKIANDPMETEVVSNP